MAPSLTTALERGFGIATGAYVEERDDWGRSLDRARREGWRALELTAIRIERLESLVKLLADDPRAVDGFDRVSVHAPANDVRADPGKIVELVRHVPYDIVFHPDVYRGQGWLRELGSRAIFENMDSTKEFGRNADDLAKIFQALPEAAFCLDVAHVSTNDATLALGHELLDRHGSRLRQLHVSGIEPNGTHRPTTDADLALYAPLLERCDGVPWLLEAQLAEADA